MTAQTPKPLQEAPEEVFQEALLEAEEGEGDLRVAEGLLEEEADRRWMEEEGAEVDRRGGRL